MTLASKLHVTLALERGDFGLNVNLELPGAGATVLFGPSGSGKTTVLRCVAGLERAKGRVTIGNESWQDSTQDQWVPTFAREVGYVFQEPSLFEHMNVRANLQFGIRRVNKPDAKPALESAITLLGISHLLGRSPQSLSGGERQRVAIARALATQPKILLLDEPLASLDIARRHEIIPWLERMHYELRIPMLYVTHSMEELTRLADHVVLLDRGKVKVQGPISQVLFNPVFAAAVGGEAGTVLSGFIKEHDQAFHLTCIDLHGSSLWVPERNLAVGSKVRVYIHANDISLATHKPDNSSIQNVIAGVVEAIHEDTHPATCLVTICSHEQRFLSRITRKALDRLSLEIGLPVWMQIKSVALTGS
jgi:molybdate transport system ATP-binding protein